MRTTAGNTIDLTGQAFGLLPSDIFGNVYWRCACRCGEMKAVRASQLRDGKFFTCGKPDCRFWEKVYIPTSGTGCWEWTGALKDTGYGQFNPGAGQPAVMAHIFAYDLLHPGARAERWVLHHCDNRKCVRDDHLFLGDHKVNMVDMAAKGRAARVKPRLSAEEKAALLQEVQDGLLTYVQLSAKYGLTTRTITRLARGC